MLLLRPKVLKLYGRSRVSLLVLRPRKRWRESLFFFFLNPFGNSGLQTFLLWCWRTSEGIPPAVHAELLWKLVGRSHLSHCHPGSWFFSPLPSPLPDRCRKSFFKTCGFEQLPVSTTRWTAETSNPHKGFYCKLNYFLSHKIKMRLPLTQLVCWRQ